MVLKKTGVNKQLGGWRCELKSEHLQKIVEQFPDICQNCSPGFVGKCSVKHFDVLICWTMGRLHDQVGGLNLIANLLDIFEEGEEIEIEDIQETIVRILRVNSNLSLLKSDQVNE